MMLMSVNSIPTTMLSRWAFTSRVRRSSGSPFAMLIGCVIEVLNDGVPARKEAGQPHVGYNGRRENTLGGKHLAVSHPGKDRLPRLRDRHGLLEPRRAVGRRGRGDGPVPALQRAVLRG